MLNFFFRYQKIVLPLFFLFCFLQNGGAQIFSNYKRYTAENGLPSSHVYDIMQDQDGFMWIATDQGVAKFDGYSFRHFTAKDGLPSNDVWKLSEDMNGRIWLSTFNEVGYMLDDKYHRVETGDSLKTNGILTHYLFEREDAKGHYIRGPELLKVENDSVFEVDKTRIVGGKEGNIHVIRRIRNNTLGSHYYIGNENELKDWFLFYASDDMARPTFFFFYRDKEGIFHFDQQILIPYIIGVKLGRLKIHHFPKHNLVIIRANQIIYSFDFKTIKKLFTIDRDGFLGEISSFKLNESEYLIQSSDTRIYNIILNEVREIELPVQERFSSIIEDKTGNLWTTSDEGVLFYSKEKNEISHLAYLNQRLNKNFVSVHKDNKGRLWFGTDRGDLFYLDEYNKVHQIEIFLDETKLTEEILAIGDSPAGGLIIAGNFGMFNMREEDILAQEVVRKYRLSDIYRMLKIDDYAFYTTLIVKDMFYGGGKNVYLGGALGYFTFSKTKDIKGVLIENKQERVYSIVHTDAGITWLGRKSGLYKVENGIEEKLMSLPIVDLHYNSNGLWVGTEGNGMYLFKGEEKRYFSETKNKTIKAIAPDEKGNIWFITDSDICRIDKIRDEEEVYDLKFSQTANGLSVNSFNKFIIENGLVYFCTNSGVQILPVSDFDWQKTKQELFFTDIQINGKSVDLKDSYELDYEENCLAINYVSLEYNKPDKVKYEYKMEGLDTLWHTASGLKQEFWFLQPGTYNFSLKAGLNSQNVSDIKQISFVIKAPWWQRPISWVLIGIGFIFAVISVVTTRSRRIIRQAKERAKIEEQIADMRLQALQSQMNPHFIFNSLQAIQDYIFDKDEEQANRYLVKFSRLMRLILESSRKKLILLSEELRLIDLYVSLEQLRFSEQFSYKLTIGENINKDTLLVPSMLIQPFIENAVNHGLFHKKDGHGLLDLIIEKENNYLIIKVKDNGIGIDAAKKMKSKMTGKDASRALEIVKERTALYNKTVPEDIDLKIENILDTQGVVNGTMVTLKLILPKLDRI